MAKWMNASGKEIGEKEICKGIKESLFLCAIEALAKIGGDVRLNYMTKMNILYDDINLENVKYSEPFTLASIDILNIEIGFDGYSNKRLYHVTEKKTLDFRIFWDENHNKLYWELASDRDEVVKWLSGMKM